MIILLSLSTLFFFTIVHAIPGRVLQGCTAVGNNVYCYGGYISAANSVFINMTTDHFTFDMSQADLTSSTYSPNWTPVPSTNSNTPALEPRASMSLASLDNTRYMVFGGSYNAALNNPALIFDSSSNTWSTVSDPPFYMKEGFMISTDNNTVWAYGGKLNGTQNFVQSEILKGDLSKNPAMWSLFPNGLGVPVTSRYGYAAICRNGVINFFGGFLELPEVNLQPNIIPMQNITFYNTHTDQWGSLTASGDTPTPRKAHTATYIPGTGKVLIYGGTNKANLQALPVSDYAYLYDMDQHAYTKLDLSAGNGAGSRMGHSAVLYNRSIFIMFGYDGSGNINDDTHILDVSNASMPVWAGQSSVVSNNGTNETSTNSNGSIGAGGIAGIVVGVVAAAGIAGAFAFFCYRKRRNRNKNEFDYYVPPPQDFNNDIPPTMFPENTDKNSNNNSNNNNNNNNHLNTDGYQTPSVEYSEPAPSYPATKPHDPQTEFVRLTNLPTIKPSENV
ncbi:uncharacterized protein BX664DRAFT_321097 [Halteromyces radiatus]|uniref:uncharacterized protein n=1 Tax=Halteromyces radiatus TaxID=101107 RepID=UPI0022209EB3|nr:uncharacterized protein BX664DRAFT_321097 [Halteromyces radiatus]KAI8099368.1 hypothetical protein BX664DRAFT_321097 [Halteromyces radiatus]